MGRSLVENVQKTMVGSLSAAVVSGAASSRMISNWIGLGDQNSVVDVPFGSPLFCLYATICVVLVIFAGLMSGLTLGLMSIGLVDLEVLKRSGTPTEKKQAAAIYPVVKKQHQLLVTLLLCNAAAMEALPVFLDKMVHPVAAVVLSVTFVLVFGEVIPQALCRHHGLAIGASMVWLVQLLMIICFVVAYPFGKMLDYLLGEGESALFRRAQLKALVSMHGLEAGQGGELTRDETMIISGALDLSEKTAKQAMTPIESTFSLDINSKLDREGMSKILARGHSRVPVFSGNSRNIIGLLLIKNLLLVKPEDAVPVSAVAIRRMPRVYEDVPLYDMLNEFQKGSSHMAAVVRKRRRKSVAETMKDQSDVERKTIKDERTPRSTPKCTTPRSTPKCTTPRLTAVEPSAEDAGWRVSTGDKVKKLRVISKPATGTEQAPQSETKFAPWIDSWEDDEEVVGIITLEDVIEELLQEEIVDETDEYIDVHRKIRVSTMVRLEKGIPQKMNRPAPFSSRPVDGVSLREQVHFEGDEPIDVVLVPGGVDLNEFNKKEGQDHPIIGNGAAAGMEGVEKGGVVGVVTSEDAVRSPVKKDEMNGNHHHVRRASEGDQVWRGLQTSELYEPLLPEKRTK